MAGYYIYSLDAEVFEQLTTSPTVEQARLLADGVLRELEEILDGEMYEGSDAADRMKWPLERVDLAESIRRRLAAGDWYADLTPGDVRIWHAILEGLEEKPGKKMGIKFRCENDGFLYWDATEIAAAHGAPMMAEPRFGGTGFRNATKSRDEIDPMYSIFTPPATRELLSQLEKAVPHFETLPEEEDGDRDQFFRGLLDPVRKIVRAGRVMWVQTDT